MEPTAPPKMMLSEEVERKINICVRRFMFRHRNQGPEETVLEYAVELRRLAKGCKFSEICVPNSDEVNKMKFPTNYYSESIRRHLFGRSLLTFENALKVAVAKEAADLEVLEEVKAFTEHALEAMKMTQPSTSTGKGNAAGKKMGRDQEKKKEGSNPPPPKMSDDNDAKKDQ